MTAAPDYAVAPGEYICEWMDDAGIKAAELSRRLDVSRKHVSELIHGKAPLSPTMARKLEAVTGVPARLWNLYEASYREALEQKTAEAEYLGQYEAAKQFPLSYLRKHGHISASSHDRAETVRQLLHLLGVATLSAFEPSWASSQVAYRRSAAGHDSHVALATWLTLAERAMLDAPPLPPYDEDALRQDLTRLRTLTLADPSEGVPEAIAMLSDHGVFLALVPAVPGLRVHGATRWVNDHPLIQLSLLYKKDDQFWFTLFHELGHVLLHNRNQLYLTDSTDGPEQEANDFAANVLVPEEYRERLPRTRDLQAVITLSNELGVAPGIVLGQAQHITKDYAWGSQLKKTIDFPAQRPVHSTEG